MDERFDRQPLPSEDTGDLVDEPISGETDDYLVAREEGVPYVPPMERVLSEDRDLEGVDAIQASDGDGGLPRDDALRADVIEALRASDVPAGDRLRIAVTGSRVHVRGEVESVDVGDEILGIVGDVVGVDEVLDELTVTGM